MLTDVSTGGQIGRHSVTCTLDVCETARLYFWRGGFTITRRNRVSHRTWHLRAVRRPVALIKLIYCRSSVVGPREGYASSLHFALTPPLSILVLLHQWSALNRAQWKTCTPLYWAILTLQLERRKSASIVREKGNYFLLSHRLSSPHFTFSVCLGLHALPVSFPPFSVFFCIKL